eukprot:CAMPEP_0115260366 /NCGR_PEP_ID=MMETSP0270-20121206/48300_1 /TAXON_ID=71861 /ORGANISM="Scrippsiella trochoidea, Strain CCMP3099" /LENGTH=30 /DNA_ID= /DNA_START= /DNA_END= /DNA_ORIENTATION=
MYGTPALCAARTMPTSPSGCASFASAVAVK